MIAKLIVVLMGLIMAGVGLVMVLLNTISRPLGYLSAVLVPLLANFDESLWQQPIWYMYIAHLCSDDNDGWWHPTALMFVLMILVHGF